MSMTDPPILDALAEAQAAFAPALPSGVLTALLPEVPGGARLAVDVGAGPGHVTRALRALLGPDTPLVAVEPVRDMRRVLLRDLAGDPELQVLDCDPEDLALPDGIAALVVVADRFRHLDPRAFLAGAARVLAPGGVLAVLRSRPAPEGVVAAMDARIDRIRNGGGGLAAAEALALPDPAMLGGFDAVEQRAIRWPVRVNARGLVDLYMADAEIWRAVRCEGLARVLPDLLALCAAGGMGEGRVEMAMLTRAVTCRKPGR